MNNENNCCQSNILSNALAEMQNRKNCCCPRYIPGPTGPTGPTGPAGGGTTTVEVGTTTTGTPGSLASVTNSGTTTNAVFDFIIPAGTTGPTGPEGLVGATGPTGATERLFKSSNRIIINSS